MAVTQQLNGGETRILEIREWITKSRKSVIQNTDPPSRHANPHCATVEKDTQIRETGWEDGWKKEKKGEGKERKGDVGGSWGDPIVPALAAYLVAVDGTMERRLQCMWRTMRCGRVYTQECVESLCGMYS
jgi:hypothetical protein